VQRVVRATSSGAPPVIKRGHQIIDNYMNKKEESKQHIFDDIKKVPFVKKKNSIKQEP
jgi:hypothetical protein